MTIEVNNKKLKDKERAAEKGLLTIEKVIHKIISFGYPSLEDFEKTLYRETVSKVNKKKVNELTENDILEHCKMIKTEYFKEMCEEKIIAGFTCSNGHFYRTNRDDQTNLIGQKDDLTDDPAEIVYWKTEDIGYKAHSQEEWIMMYKEAFRHKKEKLFIYDSLKKEIQMCESHEELLLITW